MSTPGPKLRIAPFEPYVDGLHVGKRWKEWMECFERELKYNGVNPDTPASSETAKMALLIYAGVDVKDIHDSLPTPVKPVAVRTIDWTEYRKSKEKLNIYFLPQCSNDFALYELMRLKPERDETTCNYTARLQKAADKCSFEDWSASKMIKCLIISHMQDEQLRWTCFQKEMTLDGLLELAERQEGGIERQEGAIERQEGAMNNPHQNEEVRDIRREAIRKKTVQFADQPVDDGNVLWIKYGYPRHLEKYQWYNCGGAWV